MLFAPLLILIFSLAPLRAAWPALDGLVAKATAGDLGARVALAHRCFDSQGNTRDPEIIHAAFADGAEAGLADAYAGLALCHLRGFGAEEDSHKAYRLAKLSAGLGSAKGYLALGKLAMEGRPVTAMRGRTQEFLKKAAELGDLQARYILATYKFEEGSFSQQTAGPEILEELAAQGHENATYTLFRHYEGKDEKKSATYLKQALELGVPSAHASQAFQDPRYQDFETKNTPAEDRHALDCYQRAAVRGNREEIFQYAHGLFLHPELAKEGEDWREIMAESARLGHIDSCDILAWSYYQPKEAGVKPDYAMAESFLLKTLDWPKRGRYHTLGLIYLNGGNGAEKNPSELLSSLGSMPMRFPMFIEFLEKSSPTGSRFKEKTPIKSAVMPAIFVIRKWFQNHRKGFLKSGQNRSP